jgi:hypothetical protein
MGTTEVIRVRTSTFGNLRQQAMDDDCTLPELLARVERGDVEAIFAWIRRAARARGQNPDRVFRRVRAGMEIELSWDDEVEDDTS